MTDRSITCSQFLIMGYMDGTHNYRIWDNKSNNVITSRDVVVTNHSPETTNIVPDIVDDFW